MRLILKEYQQYLTINEKSERTIKAYLYNVNPFLIYLENAKIDYMHVEYSKCIDYISYLSSCGYSKAKLNLIITSLKNFYNFLAKKNNCKVNHFKEIKQFKLDKKMPFMYDLADVFNNINKISLLKDKLILMLLLTTGISLEELSNIRIKDIDFEDTSINISGKKTRKVYFDYKTNDLLISYLSNKTNLFYLFENDLGLKNSQSTFNSILSKYDLFEAGISTNAQNLRIVFATEFLKNGMDLITLKVLLGAKTVNALEKYKNGNFKRLIDISNEKHPIMKYQIKAVKK